MVSEETVVNILKFPVKRLKGNIVF
jgi:hypothetical protein